MDGRFCRPALPTAGRRRQGLEIGDLKSEIYNRKSEMPESGARED